MTKIYFNERNSVAATPKLIVSICFFSVCLLLILIQTESQAATIPQLQLIREPNSTFNYPEYDQPTCQPLLVQPTRPVSQPPNHIYLWLCDGNIFTQFSNMNLYQLNKYKFYFTLI